jgi:SAM-dependent methyltransferase
VTKDIEYTRRLVDREGALWKRLLGVQLPYRWNLRRLRPGFTLEVGCGIGRNLGHLDGRAIGIDHNPHSVELCRKAGFEAYTPEEFRRSSFQKASFDSLLLSHVAEHMRHAEFVRLLAEYVPAVRAHGRVIVVTPQEAGYRIDPTHVEFVDLTKIRAAVEQVGFMPVLEYSFPFPRLFGHFFPYNEFVSVCARRAGEL